MCSIGAGNQAADVFKSTSHYPSDSDDESDSSALEDVKSPSDSLSFEAVVETECYESCEAPAMETTKKKSKKSKKRAIKDQ
jgi:hypothetical protein